MISYLFINVHPWNKGKEMMITLHFNSLSRLVLQPHEFSWPLLPSPSDGEPQVLGEPSLSGCIHKTILPPPASAMKRFPPRVVIMKCHRGNSWNIICACSLSPHPASPPTSLLTFWSYVCCTRKTLLAPLLPPDLQRGVSVPHSHCDKNRCLGIYPCSLTAPWYLVATLNPPNSIGCYCIHQDYPPSSAK